MRAAYQLNQEKLDYNYRVLLERDAENQATITQQKRKISKQRDLLSTLMVSFLNLDHLKTRPQALDTYVCGLDVMQKFSHRLWLLLLLPAP